MIPVLSISTSGTNIDFTGIPSWVKRITIMFNEVSLAGNAEILLQVGSGSFIATGYISTASYAGPNTVSSQGSNIGFLITSNSNSTMVVSGTTTLCLINNNTWTHSGTLCKIGTGTSGAQLCGGVSPNLSGALDRIRITSTTGTTFDAGSINILYE